MAAVNSLVLVAVFGIYLSYHGAEAVDKECMTGMQKMMAKNMKLIVPCIESLGLTTPEQKKEKALVQKYLNMTLNFEELIKLQISLSVPILFGGVTAVKQKFERFKEVMTYFLQCIMKCVMIKGQMLGPDGSVDMELAQKLIDDLPDALKSKASDVIGECGHTAAAFDPAEASCETYRDFVSCMLDVSLKMCL